MPDQSLNLWKSFLTGDKTAYKALMLKNYQYLFNYGTKFSDDEELVKDVIQELFIRLWEKRGNLSVEVNAKAYLTSSVRRALHRKLLTQSRFSNYADFEDQVNSFDIQISVEDSLIEKESFRDIATKIKDNLMLLPGRQKEVVFLKFFEELSRDEISEIMGITPQTVSNLLQLALKKLRLEMKSRILVGFS